MTLLIILAFALVFVLGSAAGFLLCALLVSHYRPAPPDRWE
jgi:hypothetical protein